MDRYLISIAGPNGAGKSTFTRSALNCLDFPVVDPDKISSQGISEIIAGKIAIRQINEYLENGVSFIKESTLTSRFDLHTIFKAQELGYQNILVYFRLPSPEVSLHRVKRRVSSGGHDISKETIYRRFSRSQENLEFLKDKVDQCFIVNSLKNSLQEIEKVAQFFQSIKPDFP